jgi:1-acyl-sn-glycerol-3-phosphate acyltransferase
MIPTWLMSSRNPRPSTGDACRNIEPVPTMSATKRRPKDPPAAAKQALARAPQVLLACYAWSVFVVFILAFFIVTLLLVRPRAPRRLARWTARLLFRLVGIRITGVDLAQLPATPHILVVNHASFLDPILLTALLPADPGYTFTTRQELRAQTLLCPLLNSVSTLVLYPSGGHRGLNIALMKRALLQGQNLLVFPEGRFTSQPGLLPFHSGAFVVAAAAQVPIVVAGLRGTRRALPMGHWMLRRTPLSLWIGPTIQPTPGDPDAVLSLQGAARAAMLPLSAEGEATDADPRAGAQERPPD